MATDHRPDVRLAAGIGVVVLGATVGPALWAWTVRDRLPDEVARHWGIGDQVTGTWPLTAQLVVLGGITAVVAVAIGALAVLSRQPIALRRMLAGCAVWTATLLGATQYDALRGQVGLTDPLAAPAPVAGILLGAVVGLGLGVAVGRLATEPPSRSRASGPPAAELPRREVAPTSIYEDAPGGSRTMTAVLVGSLAVFAVPAALGSWWVLALGVLVLAPVAALTRFRTRVDTEGLRVTSLGLELVHVPLAEVAGARVIDHLDAFWEFGGWGLRVDVHGRTGVVARSGPAIAVERAGGSEVVVTVSDPAAAAGTLNGLADLHHAAGA